MLLSMLVSLSIFPISRLIYAALYIDVEPAKMNFETAKFTVVRLVLNEKGRCTTWQIKSLTPTPTALARPTIRPFVRSGSSSSKSRSTLIVSSCTSTTSAFCARWRCHLNAQRMRICAWSVPNGARRQRNAVKPCAAKAQANPPFLVRYETCFHTEFFLNPAC